MSDCRQVVAVEKDPRFEPALELLQEKVGKERLKIVMGDILELDEAEMLAGVQAEATEWSEEGKVHIVGKKPEGGCVLVLSLSI